MFLGVTPLRRIAIILSVLLISISVGVVLLSRSVSAATGINQTINFQGRLYNAAGATVPDGFYNIQFKIYQDGTGTTAGNPGGTLEWTESHLNNNSQGIEVRNGFMSVELGSVTPFGTDVDWNQDTLWISMNIGNTNLTCTPFGSCGGDGEMVPMKRLSAVPYAMNAMQLGGKTAGDFIQSGTSPQTANFNITGTGTAATLQAATFDTAAAGTLTIGGTNATSITLADDTTLAAGKSFTIIGGTTASRPASPVDGMVYYDQDTDQLLTYTGGKWKADGTEAVLVAANDSSAADKAAADYIADGTDDQVQINAALTSADPAGSGRKTGRVFLFGGTYTTHQTNNGNATVLVPNNTTLAGAGAGTVIQLGDIDAADNLIENANKTTGAGVTIRDLTIDGQDTANTAGSQSGIYFDTIGNGTTQGGKVINVDVKDFRDIGIVLDDADNSIVERSTSVGSTYGISISWGSTNNTITGNKFQSNSSTGMYLNDGTFNTLTSNNVLDNGSGGINFESSSQNNTLTGNTLRGNGGNSIRVASSYNTISGNTIYANGDAVSFSGATNNSVNGNNIDGAGGSGVGFRLASSSNNNTINGNNFRNTGGSTTSNGIYIDASDGNTITSNGITDASCSSNCYSINIFNSTSDNTYLSGNTFATSAGTATINDSGTGTIYANQSKAAGGLDVLNKQANSTNAFEIQNAAGVAQLTADTSNSRIQIGSSTTDNVGITFTLDSYNQAGDPTGINGSMYYNTNTGKFRCYEAGAWADCVGGTGANTALSNLTATSINQSLIAGSNNTLDLGSAALGWRSGYFGTAVYSPVLDRLNAGALAIGNTNATSISVGNTSGTVSIALSSSSVTLGIATSATTLQASSQTTSNTQGSALTVQGATGNGSGAGGTVTIQGGTGGATNANGGDLVLSGGTGGGTGVTGLVALNPTAFSSSSSQSIGTDTTLAVSLINSNSTIPVNATAASLKVTIPVPTTTTTGRIIYITAANTSNDFSLLLANTSGVTSSYTIIGMRQNNTATLVWNGYAWTAAGASSSTDLQSAYNNTLQSAGGAELIVSKTSATNGLTIRDSITNSVDGTLLSVQTKSASGLFQVNSNVTEYVSNAGAETAGASSSTFPSSTWSAVGSSTVSRNTTTNNNSIATGQASVGITTTAAAQDGVKNTLVSALGTQQNYNVSFTARLSSGTFTDMNVYYSVDGTAASVACAPSKAIATSVWTKVNCTFTAPSSGITSSNAILIRQTTAVARTLYIDNLSVTIAADYNYATDGSVTDAGNFATNWSAVSGSTVTRNTSIGHDASDSAQTVTTATSGMGVRNKLAINPLPSTLYRITVRAASSNSFTDFTIRYSRDNGTNFVTCADYNTQTLSTNTSSFTEVTCYILTDSTAATNPYVYFTQNSATARTFYVDALYMNLSSNTTPNVQIGGGINGGPTTLFTLDRGASAPIASNNEALLGSMYYDTTLGKLQCYEADGWGACGSSPDNIITISPEYTNAVMHGTGVGTMTSDLCSDALNINDGSSGQATICGTNETYNFYKWTSPQNSSQTYSIYVTYQLPTTFKSFNSGQTSLMARTDSANSTVNYQVYKNSGAGLTACGSTVAVSTGVQTSWQLGTASGSADPSTCSFAGGNSIVFKINMSANSNANAYVGNLNFAFSNR